MQNQFLYSVLKRGAKLQQARLIGASDDTGKRRGALAPAAGIRPRRTYGTRRL